MNRKVNVIDGVTITPELLDVLKHYTDQSSASVRRVKDSIVFAMAELLTNSDSNNQADNAEIATSMHTAYEFLGAIEMYVDSVERSAV